MRLRKGQLSAVDGPFTETKEVIGGFAILEAGSMQEAVELTRRFLKVHGDTWDIECEVRRTGGAGLRHRGVRRVTPNRLAIRSLSTFDRVGASRCRSCSAGTVRPRPTARGGRRSSLGTSRFARYRGEYGCAWATAVRRTDVPVLAWDLRGSHGPNSPRGIAPARFPAPPPRASCEGRLTLCVASLRGTSAGQHRHCARGSRNGCVSCD